MPDFNLHQTLRHLIDKQEPESLATFIMQHEAEIDFDCISPNGASALWWALQPPGGKTISKEVIAYLLDYVKADGEPLCNPHAEWAGLRPMDYLAALDIDDNEMNDIFAVIREAQNKYRHRPARVRNNFIADMQNVHNTHVSSLAKYNAIALAQHYKVPVAVDETLQAIANKIAEITDVPRRQALERGIDFCHQNTEVFEVTYKTQSACLTLSQLLVLVWQAAHETDLNFLPKGGDTQNACMSRENAVLQALYDNATTYSTRKNPHSCPGGAYNRLSLALAGLHQLVLLQDPNPLTGNEALTVFREVLSEEIAELSTTAPDTWCALVRYGTDCFVEPRDEDVVAQWWPSTRESVEKEAIKRRIDPKTLGGFLLILDDDLSILPFDNHKASYRLAALLRVAQSLNLNISTVFDSNNSSAVPRIRQAYIAQKIIAQIAQVFIARQTHTELFGALELREELSQSLIIPFIDQWLNINYGAENPLLLNELMANPQELSKEYQSLVNDCAYLVFFAQQKQMLSQRYPQNKIWLDGLTRQTISMLLAAMPTATLHDKESFYQQLILTALAQGQIHQLSLTGYTFKQADLRHLDFANVALEEVTFEQCMLPLAAQPKSVDELAFKDCTLPNHDSKLLLDRAGKLLLASKKVYSANAINWLVEIFKYTLHDAPVTPATKALVEQCFIHSIAHYYKPHFLTKVIIANPVYSSSALLEQQDADGFNVLMRAAQRGDNDFVQELLQNPYCTARMLCQENDKGFNSLALASRAGHVEVVRSLLSSSHCKDDPINKNNVINIGVAMLCAVSSNRANIVQVFLNSQCSTSVIINGRDKKGRNILVQCAYEGFSEQFKIILDHHKCSSSLLETQDNDGRNSLHHAVSNGHTEIVKAILDHDKCTSALLSATDNKGQSVWMLAADKYPEIAKTILTSQYLTRNILQSKNKRKQNPLMYAIASKDADIIQAIIKHPDFTLELLNDPPLANYLSVDALDSDLEASETDKKTLLHRVLLLVQEDDACLDKILSSLTEHPERWADLADFFQTGFSGNGFGKDDNDRCFLNYLGAEHLQYVPQQALYHRYMLVTMTTRSSKHSNAWMAAIKERKLENHVSLALLEAMKQLRQTIDQKLKDDVYIEKNARLFLLRIEHMFITHTRLDAELTQILQKTNKFLQNHNDLKIVNDYEKFAKKMAGHNRNYVLCSLGICMKMLGIAALAAPIIMIVPFCVAPVGIIVALPLTISVVLLALLVIVVQAVTSAISIFVGFHIFEHGNNIFEKGLNRSHATPYIVNQPNEYALHNRYPLFLSMKNQSDETKDKIDGFDFTDASCGI